MLEDYNQARELTIEWNRFDDVDMARSNYNGPQPMDIGWIGKGDGKHTTWQSWNRPCYRKGKGNGNYKGKYHKGTGEG